MNRKIAVTVCAVHYNETRTKNTDKTSISINATIMHEMKTTTIRITTLKIIESSYRQFHIPAHRFTFNEIWQENLMHHKLKLRRGTVVLGSYK